MKERKCFECLKVTGSCKTISTVHVVHIYCTLWSMTPVYPSSVDVGPLSSFFTDETGPSKQRDVNIDADEEDDLSPELLLYTNIK